MYATQFNIKGAGMCVAFHYSCATPSALKKESLARLLLSARRFCSELSHSKELHYFARALGVGSNFGRMNIWGARAWHSVARVSRKAAGHPCSWRRGRNFIEPRQVHMDAFKLRALCASRPQLYRAKRNTHTRRAPSAVRMCNNPLALSCVTPQPPTSTGDEGKWQDIRLAILWSRA